ncbi:NAD-dependent epimerase/dehydratase family protein [Sphingomonas sp. AR_OL41]|uniref:NAD-dependent epimerase/dehydratase family protein n=1 Tax=Sphingomonas sp. AR_OL41 TaxID=3042729 RepID=UPI0024802FD5|nr:NAD-dependent epimerase/dehydratase family protein [Sphingomonas sp. AR_OL41]MDH7973521.1 NAD-dependent epimerase/dehydratase family protein [Sphingomonas sp. AR_OL41]
MESRTALVLGATGGIGGEVARRLVAAGWRVRALHRQAEPGSRKDGLSWIRGDAMKADDVAAATADASLVVHAVNPPGYRDWGRLVLPMLDNSIAAARANGARILLPGTVYNYGPDAFPDLTEDQPQRAATAKGRIRVEMEHRLAAVAASGGARVLIVRAGDFFGPRGGNNWFSHGLVAPGKRPRAITYPGKRGVGHQWAYLPDVAETMVRLVEQVGLDDFATFHMAGHWDADGTAMIDAIRRALGDPAMRVARMPWGLMRLAAPFVPLLRELREMKYLWDQPVRLRNDRLVALLGSEPHTPLDHAVQQALAGLGCL